MCCHINSVSAGTKIINENIINFNGKMTDKFANCKERRMDFLYKYNVKLCNMLLNYVYTLFLLKLKQILTHSYEFVLPKLYKFSVLHHSLEIKKKYVKLN